MGMNHLLNEMILQVQDFYLYIFPSPTKKTPPVPKAVRKCQCQSFFEFSRTYIIPRTCPLPNKQDPCFFNLERASFCRVEDVKVNSLKDISIGLCLWHMLSTFITPKTQNYTKLISCQLNWKPNKSMLFFFLQKISTPKISHRVHHVQDRETQDAPGSGHGRFIHHEGS